MSMSIIPAMCYRLSFVIPAGTAPIEHYRHVSGEQPDVDWRKRERPVGDEINWFANPNRHDLLDGVLQMARHELPWCG